MEDVATEVVGDYVEEAARRWADMMRQFLPEDASVEPMVGLVANDNWLEFTLRYVVDYERRRRTKDRLFTLILERIQATNGKVAMASATFELVEAPVFDVRLRQARDEVAP